MAEMLALNLVVVGLAFILWAIKPSLRICAIDLNPGWKFLSALIIGFVFAYIAFAIYLLRINQVQFIDTVLALLLFFGGLFVVIVVNFSLNSIVKIDKIAEQEHFNAKHDSLTGLPNRSCFLHHLSEKIDAKHPFALLLLDLNNFKQINDVIGHYYGDQLLVELAKRIRAILPTEVLFSRIGGDEFTLIVNSTRHQDLESICSDIHMALKQPIEIQGLSLTTSMSIGVSLCPEHAQESTLLLRQADIAMYESKRKASLLAVFDSGLNKDASAKLQIASRLESALNNDEFEMHYQAIVHSENHELHGMEALIRWPQSDGSFIAPDLFIPIAEQSSVINDISKWVLKQCRQDRQRLINAGMDVRIHINLSARDLQNQNVVKHMQQEFGQASSEAEKFVFEVTESAMMSNLELVKTNMMATSKLGFEFSVDDFGTGYSSLSLLRELPIHQIKIDRSFIMDMQNGNTEHSIVRSTIYLAHALDCSVVAEGVETNVASLELQNLGCDFQQGYYFSQALPIDKAITASLINAISQQ
ncbi:EAL domain-containing protein [Alginatibacterium sediminis]|uniref:EAL domain-containing protein n=1 Tax=Alginatibacterium sediminis TaxID=2164068 RepID=A0A420ED46_9ALTE|nr:EAL domain-containing protein [Alginatibacterium sediminis]RKF18627.1 EAL domain-containing protein [Alginatibacterium sediminis]